MLSGLPPRPPSPHAGRGRIGKRRRHEEEAAFRPQPAPGPNGCHLPGSGSIPMRVDLIVAQKLSPKLAAKRRHVTHSGSLAGLHPVRQASLAEEKGRKLTETSDTSLRVKVPTAKAGGRHAEASLARAWATTFVKRRQRADGPWRKSRKSLVVEADAIGCAEGNIGVPNRRGSPPRDLGMSAPPGSWTTARTQGLARNLGDPVASGASRERSGKRK